MGTRKELRVNLTLKVPYAPFSALGLDLVESPRRLVLDLMSWRQCDQP
jgi:hypothetical protein